MDFRAIFSSADAKTFNDDDMKIPNKVSSKIINHVSKWVATHIQPKLVLSKSHKRFNQIRMNWNSQAYKQVAMFSKTFEY